MRAPAGARWPRPVLIAAAKHGRSRRISSKPAPATELETSFDDLRRVYPSVPRQDVHCRPTMRACSPPARRRRRPERREKGAGCGSGGTENARVSSLWTPLSLATEAGLAPRVSAMATPPATGRPETAGPLHQRHGNARGTPQQRQSSAVHIDQGTFGGVIHRAAGAAVRVAEAAGAAISSQRWSWRMPAPARCSVCRGTAGAARLRRQTPRLGRKRRGSLRPPPR